MNGSESLAFQLAMDGLLNIVLTLICVGLSFWALQQLKLDQWLKNPGSTQAKLLQLLLSIALGYEVASFLNSYLSWSGMLKGMF